MSTRDTAGRMPIHWPALAGFTAEHPAVRIHYPGHASFVLSSDNGMAILTDYGESSSYGLDSPM